MIIKYETDENMTVPYFIKFNDNSMTVNNRIVYYTLTGIIEIDSFNNEIYDYDHNIKIISISKIKIKDNIIILIGKFKLEESTKVCLNGFRIIVIPRIFGNEEMILEQLDTIKNNSVSDEIYFKKNTKLIIPILINVLIASIFFISGISIWEFMLTNRILTLVFVVLALYILVYLAMSYSSEAYISNNCIHISKIKSNKYCDQMEYYNKEYTINSINLVKPHIFYIKIKGNITEKNQNKIRYINKVYISNVYGIKFVKRLINMQK